MSTAGARSAAIVGLGALATFGLLLRGGSGALAVAAGCAGVLAVAAVRRWPDHAPVVVLAAIAVVPIYWGSRVRGLGFPLVPATIGGALLLALPGPPQRPRLTLVPLDVAIAVLATVRALGYLLSFGPGPSTSFAIQLALAYLPFRLAALRPGTTARLARTLVVVAVGLALVARLERTSGNVFFTVAGGGFQAQQWARPEERFGAVRYEAGFGHPIPYGLFCALAVALCAVLALRRPRPWPHLLALGLIGAALLGTTSRGPLLVAAASLVLIVAVGARRLRLAQVVGIVALAAVALSVGPALRIIDTLYTSSTTDTAESRSAEYRYTVLAVLFDPAQRSLLGRPAPAGAGSTDVAATIRDRTGLLSLDNEYVVVFVTTGLLSFAAFIALGVLVWRAALASRVDALTRAWAIALGCTFLALGTVALLTQFTAIFFASIGVVASGVQVSRSRPAAALTGRRSAGPEDGTLLSAAQAGPATRRPPAAGRGRAPAGPPGTPR